MTRLRKNEFVFEMFEGIRSGERDGYLSKIYRLLNPNGIFLVGIQGLMEYVDLGDGIFFEMERMQKEEYVERIIKYFLGNKSKNIKRLLYEENQKKHSIPLIKFAVIAKKVGFKNITISSDIQWVILRR